MKINLSKTGMTTEEFVEYMLVAFKSLHVAGV